MERVSTSAGHVDARSVGAGEPVLLIHGSMIADTFRCIEDVGELNGYQLISYRRRGYSTSAHPTEPLMVADQTADALAVLAHFGHSTAHVVGHSFGACIALQLALDAPAAAHTLSLWEPPLFVVPAAADFAAGFESLVELWQSGDRAATVDAFGRSVAGPDFRRELDRTLPEGWYQQAIDDIDDMFMIEGPGLDSWSFGEAEALRITQPVWNVAGDRSEPLFQQGSTWLNDHLPEVESFQCPNATHLLQAMNPTDMAQGLAAFLQRHPLPHT